MTRKNFELFIEIIRAGFQGLRLSYKNDFFSLEPTLISPYDFIRKIKKPSSQFEELMISLNEGFKREARTEMYRSGRGWIDQGIYQKLIKKITIEKKTFLIPVLSSPAVGIDSSGLQDRSSTIIFSFLDDPKAGIIFLERFLNVPTSKDPIEYKWIKLAHPHQQKIVENFEHLLKIVCSGLLIIHTNVKPSPKVKHPRYSFIDLIEGCFSGYESSPLQPKEKREEIRHKFFLLSNGIPIHCDNDFLPLTTTQIGDYLVRTLSKKNGKPSGYHPLHASLKSHESEPIQIADLFAGMVRSVIERGEKLPNLLSRLYFAGRKIRKKEIKRKVSQTNFANLYYWLKI